LALQTELSELKAKHEDDLQALRGALDDTVDEFSTLSYNSRVVCASLFRFYARQQELL